MSIQKVFQNYLTDHLDLRKNCEDACEGNNSQCEKCKVIGAHRTLRRELKERLSIMEEVESSGDEDIYSFLTGSYKRGTIIRPPKDVDFFIVLKEDDYEDFSPAEILNLLHAAVTDIYPDKKIKVQTHSITIEYSEDFGIDVIPAFEDGENYKIPEVSEGEEKWLVSNPKKHEEEITEGNKETGGMLIPIVKILKSWRREKADELKSFHLEMIALKILGTGIIDSFSSGLAKFFAESGTALNKKIEDPANPDNYVDGDLKEGGRNDLIELVNQESKVAEAALKWEKKGDEDKAVSDWKKIFTSDSFAKAANKIAAEMVSKAIYTQGLYKTDDKGVLETDKDKSQEDVKIPRSSSWGD